MLCEISLHNCIVFTCGLSVQCDAAVDVSVVVAVAVVVGIRCYPLALVR